MTEQVLEAAAAAETQTDAAVTAVDPGKADGGAVVEKAQGAADPVDGLLSGEGDDKPAATPADWPEDWRDRMSGGDDKVKRIIGRYGSPAALAKALVEAKDLIRSGPKKPDAEDAKGMAEWRKANGIPEEPAGYKLPVIPGVEWSDADKPAIAAYFEEAHRDGLPQSAVETGLKWYAKAQAEAATARSEAEKIAVRQTEDELRQEWGPEYRANIQLAKRAIEGLPEEIRAIHLATLPDGRKLGANPAFIKWAAQLGRDEFGDAALIGQDGSSTISSRKAEIEKIRDTDFARYDNDRAMRDEYRKILEAEEHIATRRKA